MNRPAHHSIGPVEAPVEVVHHLLAVTPASRTGVVTVLAGGSGRSLVFARTKRAPRKLARQLGAVGIPEGELHPMARCRARILGPAATIRRRSKHAIHGAASVVMSADGLIATPMFIDSSGSPGSSPSWATDAGTYW